MGDPNLGGRVGIEFQARRYRTLQTGRTVADCYEEAADWCEKEGSNLDMFTALDVVGFPVWDGLAHAAVLEEIMWDCAGSKYLLSKADRATLLCMAAAVERQGW